MKKYIFAPALVGALLASSTLSAMFNGKDALPDLPERPRNNPLVAPDRLPFNLAGAEAGTPPATANNMTTGNTDAQAVMPLPAAQVVLLEGAPQTRPATIIPPANEAAFRGPGLPEARLYTEFADQAMQRRDYAHAARLYMMTAEIEENQARNTPAGEEFFVIELNFANLHLTYIRMARAYRLANNNDGFTRATRRAAVLGTGFAERQTAEGRHDDAAREYNRAAHNYEEIGNFGDALIARNRALEAYGRFLATRTPAATALENHTLAAQTNTYIVPIHTELAQTHLRLNDRPAAIAAYRAAVATVRIAITAATQAQAPNTIVIYNRMIAAFEHVITRLENGHFINADVFTRTVAQEVLAADYSLLTEYERHRQTH